MSESKIVSCTVGVYSIFVFFLGLNFNKIVDYLTPNVQPSQSQNPSKQVPMQSTITTLLLGFIGFAGTSILENWLNIGIEQKVDKRVDREKEDIAKSYVIRQLEEYKKGFENIEKSLNNVNLSSDEFKKTIYDIKNISIIDIDAFISDYKLAQKIKQWLDNKINRVRLANNVFDQTLKKTTISINNKYRKKFRDNILECLNWLCDSLENMTAIDWDEDENYKRELTSSITGMSDIQPYKEAINLIKFKLSEEFPSKPEQRIFNYYLDELARKYEGWYVNLKNK